MAKFRDFVARQLPVTKVRRGVEMRRWDTNRMHWAAAG